MDFVRRRREFLADVGRGMLVASVGPALALDLGLCNRALADEGLERLTFGSLEPLAALMQQTPADRLLTAVVEKLRGGTDLRELVAAAALANARAFGGQDYEGYHALMSLLPAYQMAGEQSRTEQALPVLKVLYRNTAHIQKTGHAEHETLHPVDPPPAGAARPKATALREAVRGRDIDAAELAFAAIAGGPIDQAYRDLIVMVQDHVNVHRVVLAWRAYALLDLTGPEHAHTLLRQSVRYCVDEERNLHARKVEQPLRELLPKLLEKHKLMGRAAIEYKPDDAGVERLARLIYASSPAEAAGAVASALAEGTAAEAVGEAISLAANLLVLHDPGRAQAESPQKPIGSVHGASVGVHASDAANAWRNIARVGDGRNAAASLIVGAYHTAGQTGRSNSDPYPLAEHLERVRDVPVASLLAEAEAAIRAKDQARACALVHRHGVEGGAEQPVFDLMRQFAVSEDGALHAEKYYRTVVEEFATTRPALRWRHLAALARVTASEFGTPAPGVDEARRLLGVGAG